MDFVIRKSNTSSLCNRIPQLIGTTCSKNPFTVSFLQCGWGITDIWPHRKNQISRFERQQY